MGILFSSTRGIDIACDIDLESSADTFHAYAVPDGIDIRPGDVVQVHDMPDRIRFGEKVQRRGSATVFRAGALRRLWTEFSAMFELTELYEVGFQPMCDSGGRGTAPNGDRP